MGRNPAEQRSASYVSSQLELQDANRLIVECEPARCPGISELERQKSQTEPDFKKEADANEEPLAGAPTLRSFIAQSWESANLATPAVMEIFVCEKKRGERAAANAPGL